MLDLSAESQPPMQTRRTLKDLMESMVRADHAMYKGRCPTVLNAKTCKNIEEYAKICKIVQKMKDCAKVCWPNSANKCKIMQNHANRCKIVQESAGTTMQTFAKKCKIVQNCKDFAKSSLHPQSGTAIRHLPWDIA